MSRNLWLPIQDFTSSKSKTARIIGLQPIVSNHKLYIRRDIKAKDELKQELINTTSQGCKWKYDDGADIVARNEDFIKSVSSENNPKAKEDRAKTLEEKCWAHIARIKAQEAGKGYDEHLGAFM